MNRIPWRPLLAGLPLPMLALAASYGVYSFNLLFVPMWVALVSAAAFELTYVGLAVMQGLDERQRRRAGLVSIGAVVVSILYNTLSGLFHRQPDVLAALPLTGEIALAVLHGAPLAWVAFLVADLLLHQQVRARPERAETRQIAAEPVAHEPKHENTASEHIPPVRETVEPEPESLAARDRTCKYCLATGLTIAELMAHGRRRRKYGVCAPRTASAAD